jgi:hypothetical protein
VASRVRSLVGSVAVLAACAALAGCAGRTVSLRFTGTAPDALVTIDDQPVGPLSVVQRRGVALPPGKHRVTIERPGYFPFDREVEAVDVPVALEVKLEPIPE